MVDERGDSLMFMSTNLTEINPRFAVLRPRRGLPHWPFEDYT